MCTVVPHSPLQFLAASLPTPARFAEGEAPLALKNQEKPGGTLPALQESALSYEGRMICPVLESNHEITESSWSL
jgi:hypothetical protein